LPFFEELKRRNVFRVGIAYVVVAWLVIQVADVVINNIGAPDWVFRVMLLALGLSFPLVLIFAWAFEMTPEGLKREKEVDRSQSITPVTGRKLDFTIIGILVLALAYFAVDKFVLTPKENIRLAEVQMEQSAVVEDSSAGTERVEERAIAVLPLANRSAREEDQYFTDGIHDDLLTQLSKIASLRVISRTSVMRYRDTEMSIPEIAKQLGVTAILEGGIQRSGDQIRINVQLIDSETDEHLWAEIYDRKMTADNLFAIQSEITRQIVDSLRATLTEEEASRINERPTESLEAFQEYMKGQQLLLPRTVPSIEAAKQHFEKAIAVDPNFAKAIAGLANAYHLLYEYAGWPEAESLDVAMELLNQSLELSPNLGEAFMVRGEIYRHRDELDLATADFEKAMELLPGNPTVHHWFSFVRQQQDRQAESFALMRRAHELNPMSPVIHANVAMQAFFEGDDSTALEELEKVELLHPDFPTAYTMESWIYWAIGDPVGRLRVEQIAFELDPESTRAGNHCESYISLNAAESAIDCITKDRSPQPMGRIYIRIILHLINGKRDSALAVLESTQEMEDEEGYRAYAALAVGDFEMARPHFEEEYPQWFAATGPYVVTKRDVDEAIDVSLILQRSGNEEQAAILLNAAIDAMQSMKRNSGPESYGFDDVRAYSLLGQTEAALTALEECADLEYLSGWQGLKYLPHFDAVRADPRFMAALSRLSTAADEARKRAISEDLL